MPLARLPVLLLLSAPAPALAQGLPIPFLPHAYAGVEAGRGTRAGVRALDLGAFAGVELPALPFGYLAVEGNVGRSDATVRSVAGTGATAIVTRRDPDWNWSATARAGINAVPGLAAYGLAGYGAERVDLSFSTPATGRETGSGRRTLDGLIYGFGTRYTIARALGVRVEYRKRLTDGRYDPEQVMGGVYVRL